MFLPLLGIGFVGYGVTALVAWLFWGPILGFALSLIPAGAAYAWVGNLLCVFFVAWLGGVALPLWLFIMTSALLLKLACS